MVATVETLDDHRHRVLRALGVTPYGLRAPCRADESAPSAADAGAPTCAPAVDATSACVLVMPADCAKRERNLVEQIMCALGGVFAEAVRVEVTAGQLPSVPSARAYLAFGKAQAHALGRVLPADVMAVAEVLLVDAPDVLFDAAAKRRLWQAVSGLRRQWRDAPPGRGG
ncbi:MAG TPA: hypothetical protein VFJ15_11580 [Oleiagrimonas sp.]|nr:hypothetical protein [Oleiagrimonas sp.]